MASPSIIFSGLTFKTYNQLKLILAHYGFQKFIKLEVIPLNPKFSIKITFESEASFFSFLSFYLSFKNKFLFYNLRSFMTADENNDFLLSAFFSGNFFSAEIFGKVFSINDLEDLLQILGKTNKKDFVNIFDSFFQNSIFNLIWFQKLL